MPRATRSELKAAESPPPVGLTGQYLYDTLKNDLKLELFCDVYSADKIPLKTLRQKDAPCLCILNCSVSTRPGSHFITLLVRRKDILVLDSLSLNLEQMAPVLLKRLNKSDKKIKYAFHCPLQDLTSAFCGIYCLFFCVFLSKSEFPKGRTKIGKFLPWPCSKNDDIALESFKSLVASNAGTLPPSLPHSLRPSMSPEGALARSN